MASSTAWRLRTGRAPGRPRQTGQTLVFGAAPNSTGQPQKIFVLVPSCTWTSSPITVSYLASTSSATAIADMLLIVTARVAKGSTGRGGPGAQTPSPSVRGQHEGIS